MHVKPQHKERLKKNHLGQRVWTSEFVTLTNETVMWETISARTQYICMQIQSFDLNNTPNYVFYIISLNQKE